MSAHTPGPWRIAKPHEYGRGETNIHIDAPTGFVCEVGVSAHPTADADAHLISAAPDLLEACLAMIEWDDREQDHAVDFSARMALCDLAFAKARVAIARAKGDA